MRYSSARQVGHHDRLLMAEGHSGSRGVQRGRTAGMTISDVGEALALSSRGITDDAVLNPHVDSPRIEIRRHKPMSWDNADAVAGSGGELASVVQAKADELLRDARTSFEGWPQLVKPRAPRMIRHRDHDRWPEFGRRTVSRAAR